MTGVQTCALPISSSACRKPAAPHRIVQSSTSGLASRARGSDTLCRTPPRARARRGGGRIETQATVAELRAEAALGERSGWVVVTETDVVFQSRAELRGPGALDESSESGAGLILRGLVLGGLGRGGEGMGVFGSGGT